MDSMSTSQEAERRFVDSTRSEGRNVGFGPQDYERNVLEVLMWGWCVLTTQGVMCGRRDAC